MSAGMKGVGEHKFKGMKEGIEGSKCRRDGGVKGPTVVRDGGMRTGSVKVVGRANGMGGRGGREQRGQMVMRVVAHRKQGWLRG